MERAIGAVLHHVTARHDGARALSLPVRGLILTFVCRVAVVVVEGAAAPRVPG